MMDWVEYITSDANSPMANLRRKNGRDRPWKLPYFSVGNESWGCGGNMRPEFYADNFRRYNTFVKNYSGNQIYRIACGANVADYNWTEVLMAEAQRRMNGLSLHYYTIPTGDWGRKGSATKFTEDEWNATMRQAFRMGELVTKHSAIMDKADPQKRIGLMVDEWGTWYDVEPGTNPGFLYQQSTLRDALVAGMTLNTFNNHCDRVKMANIAQMVNVLQAMILTDKEKMLVTPTYHVFEMFAVHQNAKLVPTEMQAPELPGTNSVPQLSISASRDSSGKLNVTLCNLSPTTEAELACDLQGAKCSKVFGRILTSADFTTHNTFEQPDAIKPANFTACRVANKGLTAIIPAKSVVLLELE